VSREDKGSYPLISRVPKHQNSYRLPRVLYSWTVYALPWVLVSMVLISSLLAKVKKGSRHYRLRSFIPFYGRNKPQILQKDLVRAFSKREGILGTEPPRGPNSYTCCHFRISRVGVLGLTSTREIAPRYSRCRNTENS
jgi:hypothetical protein